MATEHERLVQLEQARQLVLADATHYKVIVPSILALIGGAAPLTLQRWGSDFLAEAFASPALATQIKQDLCTQVLQTVKELVEIPSADESVVRSAIQTAASIYSYVFRYMYVASLIPCRNVHYNSAKGVTPASSCSELYTLCCYSLDILPIHL